MCGGEVRLSRLAHNQEVGGSNPPRATNFCDKGKSIMQDKIFSDNSHSISCGITSYADAKWTVVDERHYENVVGESIIEIYLKFKESEVVQKIIASNVNGYVISVDGIPDFRIWPHMQNVFVQLNAGVFKIRGLS